MPWRGPRPASRHPRSVVAGLPALRRAPQPTRGDCRRRSLPGDRGPARRSSTAGRQPQNPEVPGSECRGEGSALPDGLPGDPADHHAPGAARRGAKPDPIGMPSSPDDGATVDPGAAHSNGALEGRSPPAAIRPGVPATRPRTRPAGSTPPTAPWLPPDRSRPPGRGPVPRGVLDERGGATGRPPTEATTDRSGERDGSGGVLPSNRPAAGCRRPPDRPGRPRRPATNGCMDALDEPGWRGRRGRGTRAPSAAAGGSRRRPAYGCRPRATQGPPSGNDQPDVDMAREAAVDRAPRWPAALPLLAGGGRTSSATGAKPWWRHSENETPASRRYVRTEPGAT